MKLFNRSASSHRPDIAKLLVKRDIQGLIEALSYNRILERFERDNESFHVFTGKDLPKPAQTRKRPMQGDMDRRYVYLLLRWLTPLMIAALGVGFTLWNHLTSESGRLSDHAIREVLFFGTVGPLLAWLTLSWAVSLAEAKARATEELEQRNQELLLLNAIGETVSQSLELQEILDGALDRILGFTGLEAGCVWVLEGSALRLKSQRRVSADFVASEAIVPLGECLCGLAVQRGQLL